MKKFQAPFTRERYLKQQRKEYRMQTLENHELLLQQPKAFTRFLILAAKGNAVGIRLLRFALVVVLVWIGGLKFANYEADGIVPLVANSPLMSDLYHHPAPEYRAH